MFPTVKNADSIIEKSFKIMSKIFKRQLRIKNAEKLNFEKKIFESTATAGYKTQIFWGMDYSLGSESRSSWATFIIDI